MATTSFLSSTEITSRFNSNTPALLCPIIFLLASTAVPVILDVMTIILRRRLLNILLIPALGGSIVSILALIARIQGIYEYNSFSFSSWWWSHLRPAGNADFVWAMAGICFLSFFPLVSELALRKRFGRSPSPEIFFLRFFLLTLPLQASRLLIPLTFTGVFAPFLGLTMTRVAWFARFLGLSALLGIGNSSAETSFRRSGSTLAMGALTAIGIAVMMPLDITQPLGNLLFLSGTETALSLVTISIEILAIVSLAGSAYIQQNIRYYLLTASLSLIVSGVDMVFFISVPLLVPGVILLVIGVTGFSEIIRKIYQWI